MVSVRRAVPVAPFTKPAKSRNELETRRKSKRTNFVGVSWMRKPVIWSFNHDLLSKFAHAARVLIHAPNLQIFSNETGAVAVVHIRDEINFHGVLMPVSIDLEKIMESLHLAAQA